MDFKGTKGKWYRGVTGDVKQVGTKKVIADCFFFRDDVYMEKANAQLISCAPEMMELLIFLSENVDMSGYEQEKINDLIKKATTI